MVEESKFMDSGFNLTKYKTFKNTIIIKEQLKGECVIPVSERCSAMIRQDVNILKKMKDLGNCKIPCYVGSEHFNKALCDLGSGISLMATSVSISCGIYWDMKPRKTSIQIANKLVVMPKRIIKDMLEGLGCAYNIWKTISRCR